MGGDKKSNQNIKKQPNKKAQPDKHTHTPTKQQNPKQQNIAHIPFRNPDHRAHKLKPGVLIIIPGVFVLVWIPKYPN